MSALLAVPNVSEGSDLESLADLEQAFTRGASLLDRHTDADHHRTVFTLAGTAGAGLVDALASGAAVAMEKVDMSNYAGAHPAIGALDVCPLVWLDPGDRDAARTETVEVATQIGGLGIPVFLYGELARDPGRAERAYFRNGGLSELWLRMEAGELEPDFGPPLPHRRAGATLVTARPPLAAFNVELDSGDLEVSRSVAAGLREAGGGLPGVRAMGLLLSSGRGQARPVEAELVGLIPAAALVGYPDDVPMRGFDPAKHVIERRLEALAG
jgi:glutamate formiminotransferase